MKRLTIIIGILILAGMVAIPVLAWGPHWNWDHHMMGYWSRGHGYGMVDHRNLTSDQKNMMDTLDRTFYEETRDLRDQIRAKSMDLDNILNSATPDIDKAKTLQKEISELRAKLDEKTLTYELEARKIAPDQGMDHAGRYGHHMMMGAYSHDMDHGTGYCWN